MDKYPNTIVEVAKWVLDDEGNPTNNNIAEILYAIYVKDNDKIIESWEYQNGILTQAEGKIDDTIPSLKSDYHFHIDGCYESKSGVGSWGCVMVNGDFVVESSGIVPIVNLGTTWNVGAELYAVQRVLDYCWTYDIKSITIHYDYLGVEYWPTCKWKAKNPITSNYRDIVRNSGISITWVHDDNPLRKRAHVLANMAR